MRILRRLALGCAVGALFAAPAGAGTWESILRRTAPEPRESAAVDDRVRALELEGQIRRAAGEAERSAEERRLRERGDAAELEAHRRAEERRAATRRLERELEVADLERRAKDEAAGAPRVRAFELERDIEAARDGVERELDAARIGSELERRDGEP